MQRSFSILAAACAALFFVTASASAAVDPAVSAVQQRYAGLQSLRAEFTQTLTHKESGNVEHRTGVLFFAAPLNVRWETKTPIPELLLITPEAVWNAFPDEDRAYKYPPDISESESIVRVVTGQSALAEDFIVENMGTEKGLTRLALYPKKPTQSMTEAELVVDGKSGLIHSVRIIDFYTNTNDIVFVTVDVNPDIPASTFVFMPPESMKVEDKSGEGATSTPLMR